MNVSFGSSSSPLDALEDLLSGIGEGASQLERLVAGNGGPLAGVISPDVTREASLDLLEHLPVVGGLVGVAEEAAKGIGDIAGNLPVVGDLMRDIERAQDSVSF